MRTPRAKTLLLRAAGLNVVKVVKKGFDSGDFTMLRDDYFSVKRHPARRLSGLLRRGLEPALWRWPNAGGCTIFESLLSTAALRRSRAGRATRH